MRADAQAPTAEADAAATSAAAAKQAPTPPRAPLQLSTTSDVCRRVCRFLRGNELAAGPLFASKMWFTGARASAIARLWTRSARDQQRWCVWVAAATSGSGGAGAQRALRRSAPAGPALLPGLSSPPRRRRAASMSIHGKGGLSEDGTEGQILRDVHRTFSKRPLFVDPDGEGQAMLAMVLKRLAKDLDASYCQGASC